eukprot:gb/GECG01003208.1/.p1 GENE.gb/GECG01003208.1/~~gb/GECG01003208.1/.p1  ORF type:complete len:782 (+),score=127.03 gb/GECG01003208.1/:1-2346(+)
MIRYAKGKKPVSSSDSRIVSFLNVFARMIPIDSSGYEIELSTGNRLCHYTETDIPTSSPATIPFEGRDFAISSMQQTTEEQASGAEMHRSGDKKTDDSREQEETKRPKEAPWGEQRSRRRPTSAPRNTSAGSRQQRGQRSKTLRRPTSAKPSRGTKDVQVSPRSSPGKEWENQLEELSSVTEEDTSDTDETKCLKRLRRKIMDLRAETAGLRSATVRAQTKRNQADAVASKLQLMERRLRIQQKKSAHKTSKQREQMKERLKILRHGSPFQILDQYEAEAKWSMGYSENQSSTNQYANSTETIQFEQTKQMGYPPDGYDVDDVISKTSASLAAITGNFGLGLEIPKRAEAKKAPKQAPGTKKKASSKDAKKRLRSLRMRTVSMHSQLRSLLMAKADAAQEVTEYKQRAQSSFEIWQNATLTVRRVAAHHLWQLSRRGVSTSEALETFNKITEGLGINIFPANLPPHSVKRIRVKGRAPRESTTRPRSASQPSGADRSVGSQRRPQTAGGNCRGRYPSPQRKSPYAFADRLPEDRAFSSSQRKDGTTDETNTYQQNDTNGIVSESPLALVERCGVSTDELKAMDKLHRQKSSLNREKRVISSNISAIERRLERHLDRVFKEVEKLNSRNDKEQEKLKSLEAEEASLDRRRQEILQHHARNVDANLAGFSIDPVHIPFSRDLNSAVNQNNETVEEVDESAYSFKNIKRGYEKEIAILEAQLSGNQPEDTAGDGLEENDEHSVLTPPLEQPDQAHTKEDQTGADVGSESSSAVLSRVTFDSDED